MVGRADGGGAFTSRSAASNNACRLHHEGVYDVETKLFGGVEVAPVYFVTGLDPASVTSTGVTAVPPIQPPEGVTALGAVLLSLMTSAPWKP
jgi:hypothetical protein